jgi:uncharacterized protein (TIGR03435 family)
MKFAAIALAAASLALAQPQTFEVASIKPSEVSGVVSHTQYHMSVGGDPGRIEYTNATLADLIRTAYRINSYQLSGPAWMASVKFDIVAKLPEGKTREQAPEMLQALLAERFKLAVRHEQKEENLLAMVVAKGGPKLKPTPVGAEPRFTRTMGEGGVMRMDIAKINMVALAELLGRFMDRSLVDQTNLQGDYDLSIEFSPEDLITGNKVAGVVTPGAPASDPSGSSIGASLSRLGLKLEARKVAVDLLVVDHLEKAPSGN